MVEWQNTAKFEAAGLLNSTILHLFGDWTSLLN
jgi:hypothetical protein